MQFLRNSYYYNEIPEPTDSEGVLKFIERIGRLCYRSDNLIKDDSAAGFIERLKDRKHFAMLEHYIFTMEIPKSIYDNITSEEWFNDLNHQDYQQKIKFVNISPWGKHSVGEPSYLISGSATAFNYLWKCTCVKYKWNYGMDQICQFLNYHHPHLMVDPLNRKRSSDDKINENIRFLDREEVQRLPTEIRKIHDWMSVHFIVERSSTHDLVRHRPLVSYAQESTRYCNYDKKGLCFMIPCQFPEETKQILETPERVNPIINDIRRNKGVKITDDLLALEPVAGFWLCQIVEASDAYQELIRTFEMTPQEAKSVLPHCLRAEINITTFMNEWYHIFNMRASKAAYPQIQEVMVPLLKECYDKNPALFNGLEKHIEEGKRWIHQN